jgi:cytochrome b561
METNQSVTGNQENTSDKSLKITYIALVISFIAIGISGWTLYTIKCLEIKEPNTMDKKIDTFFEKQDQELDKVLNESKEQQ